MRKNHKNRTIVAEKCYACKHDCKNTEPITQCEHFKNGFTRKEYLDMIKDQNVNLKKMCNQYGISYNHLMDMLNGREHFSYKYRTILDARLLEVQEFLDCMDRFDEVANG